MSQKYKIEMKDLIRLIEKIKNRINTMNQENVSGWFSRFYESIRDRNVLENNFEHFLDQVPLSSGVLYVRYFEQKQSNSNVNYFSLHETLTIRGLINNSLIRAEYLIELSEFQKKMLIEICDNAGISDDINLMFLS